MDTQIWYAIFATVIGGIYGAFSHLGEVPDSFAICSYKFLTLLLKVLNLLYAILPISDKNTWYVKGEI